MVGMVSEVVSIAVDSVAVNSEFVAYWLGGWETLGSGALVESELVGT